MVVLAVAATFACTPAAQAAAPTAYSAYVNCGGAGTAYGGQVRLVNVTSTGVRCRYARSFARSLLLAGGPACDEDRICRFRKWRCRTVSRGLTLDRRCTKGRYVIRHQAVGRR